MHDAYSPVFCDVVLLVLVEEVRCLEGVVAADRDEGVDLQVRERMVDLREPLGLLRVEDVRRGVDRGTWVDPGRPDDDAPAVSNASYVWRREHAVVLGLHNWIGYRIVVLEVGVAVEDPKHLDPGF